MAPYGDFLGAEVRTLLSYCYEIESISQDDSRVDLPARDPRNQQPTLPVVG